LEKEKKGEEKEIMIITDKEQLKQKCEPCDSIEEGEEIAIKLLKELSTSGNGIGLAANQIGINKRVCVINVPTNNNKEPIILINPEIIEKSDDMFAFVEGCLSFPDATVTTKRHKSLKVKADNYDGTLYFEATPPVNNPKDVTYAYETACVQHELDHLDGITMYDREFKRIPTLRKFDKIGRNDKVLIKKENETKTIKYKKIESYLSDGWSLVEV
jgi:peptide deformylase